MEGKTEEEIEMMKLMGFASFDSTKVSKRWNQLHVLGCLSLTPVIAFQSLLLSLTPSTVTPYLVVDSF